MSVATSQEQASPRRGSANARPRPGRLYADHTSLSSPARLSFTPPSISLFLWSSGMTAALGERCADHEGSGVCRPSDGSVLSVYKWWYHWSQTGKAHTSRRLASGCLPPRLHRWLTWPWLSVSQWSLVSAWAWCQSVCALKHSSVHYWHRAWITQWPPWSVHLLWTHLWLN